jgi:hypothetical protein
MARSPQYTLVMHPLERNMLRALCEEYNASGSTIIRQLIRKEYRLARPHEPVPPNHGRTLYGRGKLAPVPDEMDPGERVCQPLTKDGEPDPDQVVAPLHLWARNGSGRCLRCDARAVEGTFAPPPPPPAPALPAPEAAIADSAAEEIPV